MHPRIWPLLIAVALLLGGGWLLHPATSTPDPDFGPTRPVTGAGNDTHTPFNLVSLPALIDYRPDGHGFDVGRVVRRGQGWVRHAVSWRGDGRRITGTLTRPTRRGPHPVVVTLHGWIRAGVYTRGIGLIREEAALAGRGYVVLHPDYRNYAGSTRDRGEADANLRGYPADVLNGIRALRLAKLRGVDTLRLGVLGRSMGGGVAVQVAEAQPTWVHALVLYSPVSTTAEDNYRRWVRPRSPLQSRVDSEYGAPGGRGWWRFSSARYFHRLAMPVQIHHGSADRTCPPGWSLATVTAMRTAGVDATLSTHPGEAHRFERSWPVFMRRTSAFFAQYLR